MPEAGMGQRMVERRLEDMRRRRRAGPRAPTTGRASARVESLLDATEALLRDLDPDDVGLYQIAERAGVPAGSVYHFFPTKDAAFLALARRYLDGFSGLMREPIPAGALVGWQSVIQLEQRRAMAFYNDHPAAMKLLYGGYGSAETRQASLLHSAAVARETYHGLDRLFHLPFLREPERKFEVALTILDAIWALSYARAGRITDTYADEAFDAYSAYCRLFLPERLELREEFRRAVKAGESVTPPAMVALLAAPGVNDARSQADADPGVVTATTKEPA